MNHLRMLLCAVLFAAVFIAAARGGEALDVRALRARLAAQEAALNDLEAKANHHAAGAGYGGASEAVVSLRKNASVTIGGEVNTRWYYRSGKIDSIYSNENAPRGTPARTDDHVYRRRAESREDDLTIADAKLHVDVQVSEHFDAFLQIDLQNSGNAAYDKAEKYYVRWKNIRNSGFGIKVGRDGLLFGEDFGFGILADYAKSGDGAFKDGYWDGVFADMKTGGVFGDKRNILFDQAMSVYNEFSNPWKGQLPVHNHWDGERVLQITPYWESRDGKFSAEFSLFQDRSNWIDRTISWDSTDRTTGHVITSGGKYKSRNYGTSVSGRLRWKPVEGLILSASAVNFRDNLRDSDYYDDKPATRSSLSRNNSAVDLAFSYRPAFLPALRVWGQFIYGWDVNGYKDVDAYTLSYGAAYTFRKNWTVFASGDWLVSKDTYQDALNDIDDKATMSAAYGGIRYTFPHGAYFEVGWKRENLTLRQNMLNSAARGGPRRTTLKGRGDTVYAQLGFSF